MAIGERSFADVLNDVIRNVQDIVRSEVRLAKAEMREEVARAKSSAFILISGTLMTFFAMLFLLLTITFSLALLIPIWAATLITGTILAVMGGVALQAGVRRFRELYAKAEGTVETSKGVR